jgi:hypothetical protein
VERNLIPGVSSALEHMPAASLETIRSASIVSWVDMEHNLLLNEAIHKAIGVQGGRDFYRTLYADFFERSVFRAFMSGIRALGARDPGAYLKHAPRGWGLTWRGLGHVEVGPRGDHVIELFFKDQPVRLFDEGLPWFEYLTSVFEVAFDFCEIEGSSEVFMKNPNLREARLRFEWS